VVFGAWPSGTTATVSSAHDPNYGSDGGYRTYGAGNTIDQDLATFWNDNTSGGYPDTLTVSAPSATTLSGVAFRSSPDGAPADFTVQTWNGSAWIAQATVTGNTAVTRWIVFPAAVTTNQVRVVVTRDATINGEFTRIAELAP
jgi:alpha-L-rhamnosidase